MNKTVFVQKGKADVGKTTTIRLFLKLFKESFPNALIVEESPPERLDMWARLSIPTPPSGNVQIGVETLGDPSTTRPTKTLESFAKNGCVAIVTASRSRGKTCERVEGLERWGYTIEWRERVKTPRIRDRVNREEAEWLLAEVTKLVEDAVASAHA